MSTFKNSSYVVRQLIVDNVDGFVDDVVKVGALDDAFNNAFMIDANDPAFCVVNHYGGYADTKTLTFGGTMIWRHWMTVNFFIPLQSMLGFQQIEDRLLEVYDSFLTTIAKNSRCLGNNSRMVVERAFVPDVYEVHTQMYAKLAFRVEIIQNLDTV